MPADGSLKPQECFREKAHRITSFIAAASLLCTFASSSLAQDARWGSPDEPTVKFMLGDVKVRFFGDSIAIAYGAESRIGKTKEGTEAKRCQVWTDTWLKRNGQWQIVAAQDTVIPCGT